MQPKNIPVYTEQNGSTPTNTSQQYRSSVAFNPNLVVTQQQQPSRPCGSNQLNSNNLTMNNQLEIMKRMAALIQSGQPQQQQQSLHLINRSTPPTSLQINQSQPILLDRSQILRNTNTQTENTNVSNMIQTLCLFKNGYVQNDKKQIVSNSSDISKESSTSAPLNSQVLLANQSNNVPAISINTSLHPGTLNQNNQTLFTMSNTDLHLMEVLNRINAQSKSTTSNENVIQLLNALQKQQNHNLNSPGFMVIEQSNLKNTQPTSLESVNNRPVACEKNIYIKNQPHLKTSNIPILNFLDKMSNNENTSERSLKTHDIEYEASRLANKISNQSQVQQTSLSQIIVTASSSLPSTSSNVPVINHTNNVISTIPDGSKPSMIDLHHQTNQQRLHPHNHKKEWDIIINSQEKKSHQTLLKTSPIDTHQILRNDKDTSILLSNTNQSSNFNNDDMINQHFKKSLSSKYELKKSLKSNNSENLVYSSIKTKSMIDLDIPENIVLDKSSNNASDSYNLSHNSQLYNNQLNKYSIKQKAESLVDDLLNQNFSLRNTKPAINCNLKIFNNGSGQNSATQQQPVSVIVDNDYHNSLKIPPSSLASSSGHNQSYTKSLNLNNPTEGTNRMKMLNFSHRDAPSKSDLPLKKRIMLDFNENCANDGDNKVKMECQSPLSNGHEKSSKIRRKRHNTESSNGNSRSNSTSTSTSINDHSGNVSGNNTVKKRRGRIPGSGKTQKMKEENRLREITKLNYSGTENTWNELIAAVSNPPDIDKITSRTLCNLNLEPLKITKEPFFQIGACNEIAPRMVKCRSCRQNSNSGGSGTSGPNNDQVQQTANVHDDVSSVKSGSGKDSTTTTGAVSSFCRFHGFRKLQFSSKGTISQAGFCKSFEADDLDLSLWRMNYPPIVELPVKAAKYLLENLSGIFCEIIELENEFIRQCYEAFTEEKSNSQQSQTQQTIRTRRLQLGGGSSRDGAVRNSGTTQNQTELESLVWKRPVLMVREMCDVCETSIFNTHWVCRKCGYSVCVDCYQQRTERSPHNFASSTNNKGDSSVDSATTTTASVESVGNSNASNVSSVTTRNEHHQNTRGVYRTRLYSISHPWAVCTANRQSHNPDQLLKAELIPTKVLNELRNRMHTVAKLMDIKLQCECLNRMSSKEVGSDMNQRSIIDFNVQKQESTESLPYIEANNASSETDLHLLADCALKDVCKDETMKQNSTTIIHNSSEANGTSSTITTISNSTSDSFSSTVGVGGLSMHVGNTMGPPPVLSPPHQPEYSSQLSMHYNNAYLASTASHSWVRVTSKLKILCLHDAQNPENFKLFQKEWVHCRPLIVSGCHRMMNEQLWNPEKFLEDFENETVQLVDCETNLLVSKGSMRSFWEGFECLSKRILGEKIAGTNSNSGKRPACLKLKDWPPSDDFNDLLPQRCRDILSNLPIPEYTGRRGEYNLAGHLLDFFVRPDLGPKLYNAYGMPRESKLGTTNLHIDIADAVNVMLYVGVPEDNWNAECEDALSLMRESDVDRNIIERAESNDINKKDGNYRDNLPGALWHIFLPSDVEILRQFLSTIYKQRNCGEPVPCDHDPIHDQNMYLDNELLSKLRIETGIEPCTIVQFRGDAVFIPAGAPHQVRNLHSCMKVANDFVSPENIRNCLNASKEFRKLSSGHSNHEDKLQAKNMIFHTVKDAVANLIMSQYDQFQNKRDVISEDEIDNATEYDKLDTDCSISHIGKQINFNFSQKKLK